MPEDRDQVANFRRQSTTRVVVVKYTQLRDIRPSHCITEHSTKIDIDIIIHISASHTIEGATSHTTIISAISTESPHLRPTTLSQIRANCTMPTRPFSAQSSSCSTPEPDLPQSSSSSFTHQDLNDDYEASEKLRRNITELTREAAVDARNARKGSLNEEYIRKLVEEVEIELGVKRSCVHRHGWLNG